MGWRNTTPPFPHPSQVFGVSMWDLGLLRFPDVQDVARSQPGIAGAAGLERNNNSHLWSWVTLEINECLWKKKMGKFPFINIVWILSLPVGVRA